ncbi:F-box/LRR-repeat protein 12-like [Chenopodium quinoa]|uniref:F-box/LRR-repeat protein 12 n=1 Tax=Chenopodium quinoa TaxID=63459 RepID=A0A803MFN2_CHEQI|nr:F-box/LRR-repeat protein 12-like [Chenopodium quinoa]
MEDSESDSLTLNMDLPDDCVNVKYNVIDDSQTDNSTTIMDLPDDCLVFIFKWLSDERDREVFGLTCTRWLDIQNRNQKSLQFDCSLTYTRQLSRTPRKIDTHDLHRALSCFQYLRSLSLSGCTELPDSGLKLLQCFGSSLRALHLDCCFEITDNGLSFVASGCPFLIYISLYRCNITDVGLEILAKSCLGLEDVNLMYCLGITDHGINGLVQNCAYLYGIRISNCRGMKGVGFHGCSQTLAYLEAESCKLEPEGIASMVSGGGLEYLNISNLSWSIRGDGLSAIGGGFAKMLRVLNMRLCRIVRDEDVALIAKGCPSLVEWNLALCHEIRVAGWESIALNCHNLERLHVNRCRNLCDRGLEALKNGCKKLTVL